MASTRTLHGHDAQGNDMKVVYHCNAEGNYNEDTTDDMWHIVAYIKSGTTWDEYDRYDCDTEHEAIQTIKELYITDLHI